MKVRGAAVFISVLSALALGLAWQQTTEAGITGENDDHEAVVVHANLACGVERWSIKTGTDAQARKVNTTKIYTTTLFHMIRLQAPADPSPYSRDAPVETTTWQLTAKLIRIKEETDSDFHLVLEDSGGRTMIAEAPFPGCIGSSSPFIHQINYVRSKLVNLYHPLSSGWEYPHQTVTVKGVGFFDFKHGQSGVAPNAIELHPLLGFAIGNKTKLPTAGPPPAPAKPTPRPNGGSTTSFTVRAYVSPTSMSHDAYPTLYAVSTPGAVCSASLVYSTGASSRSFDGSAQTVSASGRVSWSWHEETSGSGGTATVSCRYHGATKTARAGFSVG
jgi:hypothetical protein